MAWTAGTNTVVTSDTFFVIEGTYGQKIVVAAAAGTNEILAYKAISALDLSDYDTIEFSMYSSIALTAGQVQLHLSSTAAIASAEETLNVPAMSAATRYRHSVALANPHLDTAIISVGLYQVADVGACTLYIDKITAVNAKSKQYKELPSEYWNIAKGTTPYLQITSTGLAVMGDNTQLRLTGYKIPALLTANSDVSEIDPGYLIPRVTGWLLLAHAKSSALDIHDRRNLSQYWLIEAERRLSGITTQLSSDTRSIS